jgi:hypothetical protein
VGFNIAAMRDGGQRWAGKIMSLEEFYSGDKAFAAYASTPDPDLDAQLAAWSGRAALAELCGGDELLARSVFFVASIDALEYMQRSVPALDGLSPVECLRTDLGIKRFKECLLRTPH